jgi:hypothetical protein
VSATRTTRGGPLADTEATRFPSAALPQPARTRAAPSAATARERARRSSRRRGSRRARSVA